AAEPEQDHCSVRGGRAGGLCLSQAKQPRQADPPQGPGLQETASIDAVAMAGGRARGAGQGGGGRGGGGGGGGCCLQPPARGGEAGNPPAGGGVGQKWDGPGGGGGGGRGALARGTGGRKYPGSPGGAKGPGGGPRHFRPSEALQRGRSFLPGASAPG